MKLTEITNPVALRRDTTVGTRIFAGDTMIHGDTGWRALVEWDITGAIITGAIPDELKLAPSGNVPGGLYIRRENRTVYVRAVGEKATVDGTVSFTLPTGFTATAGRSFLGNRPTTSGSATFLVVGGSNFRYIGAVNGQSLGGTAYINPITEVSFLTPAGWPVVIPWNIPKNTTYL